MTSQRAPLSQLRSAVVEIVRRNGLHHFDEPVKLASGELSLEFIDAKEALARGEDLKIACQALLEVVQSLDVAFDAIGGLTLGADQFAHAVAVLGERMWFVVRKAVKGRGTNRRIEGASLGPGVRVLLVDDVVTTGGSIREAYDVIRATGAPVVAAVTLVDRGETAAAFFRQVSIPYRALMTYRDLNIEPVGGGRSAQS